MLDLLADVAEFARPYAIPAIGGAAFMSAYYAIATDTDYKNGWLTASGARRNNLTNGNIPLGRVGRFSKQTITAPKESFILAIGPTGHGKTKNLIENIIFSDKENSQVIFDLKGDLIEATAYARSLVGPVYVLDPSGGPTNHYNPYIEIPPGNLAMIKDYHSWIVPQGSHEFYGPIASDLFFASGAHILHCSGYDKTMPGMYGFLTTEGWLEKLKESPIESVRQVAMSLQGNTAREITASILRYLGWLSYPSVKHIMSKSELRLSEIQTADKPFTVYIRLPEQSRLTMMPFARSILGMLAMCMMKSEKYSISGERKRRGVTIVIDEAKQLALPNIDTFYSAARSAGARIVMASQLISEIRELYKKSVEGNSSTQLFTRTASFEESKYVADILPKHTITRKTVTKRYESKGFTDGKNIRYDEMEDPILTQSGVMKLRKYKDLVGIVDGHPVKMTTIYSPKEFKSVRGKPFKVTNVAEIQNPWDDPSIEMQETERKPKKAFQPRAKNVRIAK